MGSTPIPEPESTGTVSFDSTGSEGFSHPKKFQWPFQPRQHMEEKMKFAVRYCTV